MYVCAGWLARGSELMYVSVGGLFGWVVCWPWQAAGYLHAINMAWRLAMVTKMPPNVGDNPGVVRGCRGANVGVFAGSKLPLQFFLFPPARYLVQPYCSTVCLARTK